MTEPWEQMAPARKSGKGERQDDGAANDQEQRNHGEPLRVDGESVQVTQSEAQDGESEQPAQPAKPLQRGQHIAHLSFSITALCGLFSAAGGLGTLAVFITLYTLLLWISYRLGTKAAPGMRRDGPGLQEFRLMRLPLAIGGVGFALDALASGTFSPAPMLVFAFSAFGCGLADGQRWAEHKMGGAQ